MKAPCKRNIFEKMQQLVALVLRDGAPEGVGQKGIHHQEERCRQRQPADLPSEHQCQAG
ncbi:hypothetical protein LP415_27635 [Polaromonas sp. P1(28)-8]|nr:hypothetical protein LP415_27635 [Polaromonas sp. P1(28)-8]